MLLQLPSVSPKGRSEAMITTFTRHQRGREMVTSMETSLGFMMDPQIQLESTKEAYSSFGVKILTTKPARMRPSLSTYEVRGNRTSLVTKSEEFVSFRARLLESLKTGNTQKEQNRTCLAGRQLDRWGWSQAGGIRIGRPQNCMRGRGSHRSIYLI